MRGAGFELQTNLPGRKGSSVAKAGEEAAAILKKTSLSELESKQDISTLTRLRAALEKMLKLMETPSEEQEFNVELSADLGDFREVVDFRGEPIIRYLAKSGVTVLLDHENKIIGDPGAYQGDYVAILAGKKQWVFAVTPPVGERAKIFDSRGAIIGQPDGFERVGGMIELSNGRLVFPVMHNNRWRFIDQNGVYIPRNKTFLAVGEMLLPKGKIVFVATDESGCYLCGDDGRPLNDRRFNEIEHLTVNPDGKLVFAARVGGVWQLWNLQKKISDKDFQSINQISVVGNKVYFVALENSGRADAATRPVKRVYDGNGRAIKLTETKRSAVAAGFLSAPNEQTELRENKTNRINTLNLLDASGELIIEASFLPPGAYQEKISNHYFDATGKRIWEDRKIDGVDVTDSFRLPSEPPGEVFVPTHTESGTTHFYGKQTGREKDLKHYERNLREIGGRLYYIAVSLMRMPGNVFGNLSYIVDPAGQMAVIPPTEFDDEHMDDERRIASSLFDEIFYFEPVPSKPGYAYVIAKRGNYIVKRVFKLQAS